MLIYQHGFKMDIQHIAVIATPDPTWLNYAGIFALPIVLLIITLWFTHSSNKKSSREVKERHKLERQEKLKDDVYYAIDNVFRAIQLFRQLKSKIKAHQDNNVKLIISKEPDLQRNTSESKQMQHDLRMWHYKHEVDQCSQLGESLIDVVSAQTRAQFLLGEDTTKALDAAINEIRIHSEKSDIIPEELMNKCIDEINKINEIVGINPDKWVK